MTDYKQFCVEEAMWHIEKATEILKARDRDAKKYYEETMLTYRSIARAFPLLLWMRYSVSQLVDQGVEESSRDTPSPDLSDEDNCTLESLPTHLRF